MKRKNRASSSAESRGHGCNPGAESGPVELVRFVHQIISIIGQRFPMSFPPAHLCNGAFEATAQEGSGPADCIAAKNRQGEQRDPAPKEAKAEDELTLGALAVLAPARRHGCPSPRRPFASRRPPTPAGLDVAARCPYRT